VELEVAGQEQAAAQQGLQIEVMVMKWIEQAVVQ
jgi:hypothetical protein